MMWRILILLLYLSPASGFGGGTMGSDALFVAIEEMHGHRPWGKFLDAGTGVHSLKWIRQLGADEVKAVTVDTKYAEHIGGELSGVEASLVIGNWKDPTLLEGETFDVILADYLIGAMHGFSPYWQDEIFSRLRSHLSPQGRLYIVGMEPLPDCKNGTCSESIVSEAARLRDACILLAGHRCYLEFPQTWVERTLKKSAFKVCASKAFPILHSSHTINKQLDVARSKLPLFVDEGLRDAMHGAISSLASRVDQACRNSASGRLSLSWDYVIAAEPIADGE